MSQYYKVCFPPKHNIEEIIIGNLKISDNGTPTATNHIITVAPSFVAPCLGRPPAPTLSVWNLAHDYARKASKKTDQLHRIDKAIFLHETPDGFGQAPTPSPPIKITPMNVNPAEVSLPKFDEPRHISSRSVKSTAGHQPRPRDMRTATNLSMPTWTWKCRSFLLGVTCSQEMLPKLKSRNRFLLRTRRSHILMYSKDWGIVGGCQRGCVSKMKSMVVLSMLWEKTPPNSRLVSM